MKEIFTITRGDQARDVPRESMEKALDRILANAWRAGHYKMESEFNFLDGQTVQIPVTALEFPVVNTCEEIIAHLHHYGILTEYNQDIEAEKQEETELTPRELRDNTKAARNEGLPFFRWVFRRSGKGHGGRRPMAGRKKAGTTYVSAVVPVEIVEALKEVAEEEGVSLSSKTAAILADWYKEKY